MDNKQTAVEWLVNQISNNHDKLFKEFYNSEIEQAKEMEKEQIMMALKDSWNLAKHSNFDNPHAEQYYNQTFKQD